jgi:hypothetical protein
VRFGFARSCISSGVQSVNSAMIPSVKRKQ